MPDEYINVCCQNASQDSAANAGDGDHKLSTVATVSKVLNIITVIAAQTLTWNINQNRRSNSVSICHTICSIMHVRSMALHGSHAWRDFTGGA